MRGKIAATFQAKEDGIHGLVATDSEETAELFERTGTESYGFAWRRENDDVTELHCAHIKDLDLNHFSMGAFGVDARMKLRPLRIRILTVCADLTFVWNCRAFYQSSKGTLAQEA